MSRLLNKIMQLFKRFHLYRKFAHVGGGSNIGWTLRIQGGKNIVIGNQVNIGKSCWLGAMPLTAAERCELKIGDACQIGDFNHLFAVNSIDFESNVLTANNVYVTDNVHRYDDIDTPILSQPIKLLKPVVIGRGCWLGENVAVIGASIGRNSVVGANSVVTHDIPDYCVAEGAPARIIKRYNRQLGVWEKENG